MQSSECIGDVIWFVSIAPDKVRALTIEQLDDAYQSGQIDEDTLVRKDGELSWARLGALPAFEPHEREDDLEIEVIALVSSPPPLPARAAHPRATTPAAAPERAKSWRERVSTWASFGGEKLRAVRRRPFAIAGVAAGAVSLLALLAFVGVARPSGTPELAGSLAGATRPAVNAARAVQAAPPRKRVAPVAPAARRPAPVAATAAPPKKAPVAANKIASQPAPASAPKRAALAKPVVAKKPAQSPKVAPTPSVATKSAH